MSISQKKTYGSKANNDAFQRKIWHLIAQAGAGGPFATEMTAQSILAALQNGIDFEARLVVDAASVTWLEVRIWNQGTSSFDPPIYFPAGSNIPGAPTLPVTYINPSTLLSQIASNTANLIYSAHTAFAPTVSTGAAGSVAAGTAYSVIFHNVGLQIALVNGAQLKPGASKTYTAGPFKYLPAITYDPQGSTLEIERLNY